MVVNSSKKKKRKKKENNANLDLKDNIVNDNMLDDKKEELCEKDSCDCECSEVSSFEDDTKNEYNDSILDEEIVSDKKHFKGFKIFLILLIMVLLVILSLVIVFPKIELKGSNEISISYNEKYVEPGYNIYILNKRILGKIDVDSNLVEGVLGKYKIVYSYSFLGFKVKRVRVVNVIDNINPVLKVLESEIKVCPNQEVPNIEYTAIDEYDGDITSKVEKVVNDDNIILKVSDGSNNQSFVSVKIDRSDSQKPNIKLKGSSSMFITYGSSYSEPGYSANDNCGGDITSKVKVIGNVGKEIGKYQIKYEVSDDSGNKAIVIRNVVVGVKVTDKGSINKGTIYLTFDDGPNQGTTNKILDILKSEGVKATFFVTSRGPDSLIKRMYEEGHTIGLHTASHDYSYVYASLDNYFNDLYKVRDRVKRITGVDSKIIRFPGGSSNTISRNYSKGIMTVLTNTVLNDGYRYFDWNVDGCDASSARNSQDVYYNVTSNLSYNNANVVLLHDIKSITVSALKDIIKFGREYGYEFRAIDMNTYMVRHKVNN